MFLIFVAVVVFGISFLFWAKVVFDKTKRLYTESLKPASERNGKAIDDADFGLFWYFVAALMSALSMFMFIIMLPAEGYVEVFSVAYFVPSAFAVLIVLLWIISVVRMYKKADKTHYPWAYE